MPDKISLLQISSWFASFAFGVIGLYHLRQGVKQGEVKRSLIGLALMAYSYFFDNALLVWLIGAGLCLAQYLT